MYVKFKFIKNKIFMLSFSYKFYEFNPIIFVVLPMKKNFLLFIRSS